MRTTTLILLLGAGLVHAQDPASTEKMTVHEWGTFTCLQDENGVSIKGINTDEEPLPPFAHDLAPNDRPVARWKGLEEEIVPVITMRLETPVIYFHPPKNATLPLKVSVKATFHGGWLTQFFPAAEDDPAVMMKGLSKSSAGWLEWKDLMIGTQGKLPETTARVWTAPRAVNAATITGANKESEKFVFYRGVGQLNPPLRVRRGGGELTLSSQLESTTAEKLEVSRAWLVETRKDGQCAFRPLEGFTILSDNEQVCRKTPDTFVAGEFAANNLRRLRLEVRGAIVADGLFVDEADALLNTWEASYFKAPGQRVFFLLPRAWTDRVLPLEISTPCKLSRTMVGRIELVTPAHREALLRLSSCPAPAAALPVRANLAETPKTDDPLAAAFYSLGRFRNALVRAELERNPSRTVQQFAKLNRLTN